MRRGTGSVLRGNLRHRSGRYVSAALAVVIAVVFLVVTDAVSSAARSGYVAGLDAPYRNADGVVTSLSGTDAANLVRHADREGDSVGVLGWTHQSVSQDGRRLAGDVTVAAVADDPSLHWQELEKGRFPTARGEALADVNQAEAQDIEIGETVRIGDGARGLEATVVGLVDAPSATLEAALYLPWADLARWSEAIIVDSVAYRVDDGTGSSDGSVDAVDATVAGALPEAKVASVDDFVAERAAQLTGGVNVLERVLLLFAALALGVSVLVVANTFAILFAQRTREFALLRCVGATPRQLLHSVRLEALALGAVAAAAGVGLGAVLGWGLVATVRALTESAPLGPVTFSPGWLLGSFLAGVALTWVASWLPTRRAVATDPIAALAPTEAGALSPGASRRTVLLSLPVLGVGILALAAAVAVGNVGAMLAGGALTFLAVVLLGPVLVPGLIRAVGTRLRRLPAGRLAAANAVRHPKRTATTTASLLIGVTLTSAVLTGLASSQQAAETEMLRQHPVDLTVTRADGATGPDAETLAAVRRTDGVASADLLAGVEGRISGVGRLPVLAPAADLASLRTARALPRPGTIHLPVDMMPENDRVTLRAGTHRVTLTAVAAEGWGRTALVAPATMRTLGATSPTALWVTAEDGADPEELAGDLSALTGAAEGHAELENGLAQRAWVTRQFDILAAAVVGLLGIAVVIALVGIANTLGLSVIERGREHALLRAVGLTRRQLRRMLCAEGLLLAGVATAVGVALGVIFAWVGVRVLVAPLADGAVLSLPVAELAVVAAGGALAGVAAALVPARRAARVPPAAGVAG